MYLRCILNLAFTLSVEQSDQSHFKDENVFGDGNILLIKLLSTEKARAFCYINSREGRCTTQSSTPVTISQCCCSAVAVEKSVSWGPGCDPCPPQGTSMFERLCSRGPGRDSFGLSKLIYH